MVHGSRAPFQKLDALHGRSWEDTRQLVLESSKYCIALEFHSSSEQGLLRKWYTEMEAFLGHRPAFVHPLYFLALGQSYSDTHMLLVDQFRRVLTASGSKEHCRTRRLGRTRRCLTPGM